MPIEEDYPLNCIESTGDGFSGWFAITNPRRCNDFCYWNVEKEETYNDSFDDDDTNSDVDSRYTALNTANPHETTVVYDLNNSSRATAHWVCIYDSADDKTLISQVKGEKWIETWHQHLDNSTINSLGDSNVPFPFLRCHKGAGEYLRTYPGDAVQSPVFWESWIILCSLIIAIQIATLCIRYKKRKVRYDRLYSTNVESEITGMNELQLDERTEPDPGRLISSNGTTETESMEIEESIRESSIVADNQAESTLSPNVDGTHRMYCYPYLTHRSLRLVSVLSVVAMNGLLVITIAFSSLSLMETKYHVKLSEAMEKFTPACTNPHLVCKKGNQKIDEHSTNHSESSNPMVPFSYIIASDAQLYWFNGEFAEMGEKDIPSFCSEKDSCGQCTAKLGYNSNLRVKRAWEFLMAAVSNDTNTPTPNTLIMNGDLTAYFHPYQKDAYESIYSDIDGLKHYFPGLGNHDIEHIGGAMFGGDEWIGPPNCNVEHAIGYLKSGFCRGIPNFLPERIVRYDPASLAYSWEEGRFHFVMLHYYPTFELASMNFRNSMVWLERDLQLAQDSGLSSILYVHAAEGLSPATEDVILGKDVKAIFAGHTHRCLHRRCEGVYPLNQDQVHNLELRNITVDRCVPAAYDVCKALEGGQHFIRLKDTTAEVTLPQTKIQPYERKDKPLCPKPSPIYVNETDNTLLCRHVVYSDQNFPFHKTGGNTESIPVFWSGSSSFETFLKADFYEDRFVVNALAATNDGVSKYVDVNDIPNPRIPYHEISDLEEVVIYI